MSDFSSFRGGPPLLAQCLEQALGRGTVIDQQAEDQLTQATGTLSTQLKQLLDQFEPALRELLGVSHDLPPRRPTQWTLLTEHENAVWPVLALSRPPTLSALSVSRMVRHLATNHLPMEMAACRQWAQAPDTREGTETVLRGLAEGQPLTWNMLLAAILSVQTQHMMVHTWGVLSALVGMTQELRLRAAQSLHRTLQQSPALVTQPTELAAEALWAGLYLLHGGLPRPATAQVVGLASIMRVLPAHTSGGPLPALPELKALLSELLPALDNYQQRELAEYLSLMRPADPNQVTTGIIALNRPGQSAVWLRRAGEVQLMVSRLVPAMPPAVTPENRPESTPESTPEGVLEVRAWRWRLPSRETGF